MLYAKLRPTLHITTNKRPDWNAKVDYQAFCGGAGQPREHRLSAKTKRSQHEGMQVKED